MPCSQDTAALGGPAAQASAPYFPPPGPGPMQFSLQEETGSSTSFLESTRGQ